MKTIFILIAIFIFVVQCMAFCADTQSAGTNITVLSPKVYQVFQRTTRFDGYIILGGRVNQACDKLQVRVTGQSLKGKLSEKWQTVPFNSDAKDFSAKLPVIPGGWYTVELLATNAGKAVAQAKIEKVGVGEVFVGAGQSNSTNCGQEKTSEKSGMVSSFSGSDWQLANDPQPGAHDKSMGGSFWPAFGDEMYAKFKVPIGVAVAGHGGTSVNDWQPNGELFNWMMARVYKLGPLGFRAILWHQGESDAYRKMPTDEYVQKLSLTITQSNVAAGWSFPWFVAQASYNDVNNPTYPLIREAQKKLWDTGVAQQGPDTDVLRGDNRDYDGVGIHFSPKGLAAHGIMWADIVGNYLDKVLDSKIR